MKSSHKKGFTLIEVLLVIVVIAILAGIVIVAINPARQISQANNTQRSSDVKAILDAVHEYAIDNRGALPPAVTNTATVIGDDATEIDICADLVPTYIAAIPFDPTDAAGAFTDCTTYNSGYQVSFDAAGRVTVAAPGAELNVIISVTR